MNENNLETFLFTNTILILNKISIQAVCNVNAFLSTLIIITEAYVCKILLNPMFLNIEFTRTL